MADGAEAERKPAAPAGRDTVPSSEMTATPTAPGGLAVTPDDPARRTSLGRLAVQAKTAVGAATDPAERDADRVADRVIRQNAGTAAAGAQAEAAQTRGVDTGNPDSGNADTGNADTVRRDSIAPSPPVAANAEEPVTDRVQSLLDASNGRGAALPAEARSMFESSLGRDLSGVRVHDDDAAHEATATLGALAFTRGSDIYMSAGRYDPDGPDGRRLLAHELAHVVQQDAAPEASPVQGAEGTARGSDGTARRAVDGTRPNWPARPVETEPLAGVGALHNTVRRSVDTVRRKNPPAGGTPAAPKAPSWTDPKGNAIDTTAKTVTLVNVGIPQVKIATIGNDAVVRKLADRQARPSTESYTTIWSTAAKASLAPRLTTFLQSSQGQRGRGAGAQSTAYYFRYGKTAAAVADTRLAPILGRESDIAEALWRPLWEKGAGEFAQFDIDHKKDWSMSGPNTLDNLWLLERRANQRLGSLVWTPVTTALNELVAAARPHLSGKPPTADRVDRDFTVTIRSWRPSGAAVPGNPTWTWSVTDLATEALTKYLRPVTGNQRKLLTGTGTSLAIFSRQYGRSVRQLPFTGPGLSPVKGWGKPKFYQVESVQIDRVGAQVQPGSPVGTLNVRAFQDNKYVTEQTVPLPIVGMAGVDYGGAVSSESARARIRAQLKQASPIEFESLEFDVSSGFVARGVIRPNLSVLRNAELAILIGDGITVEASLSGSNLTLPGPLTIVSGAIVARIGTSERASISGSLAMEIADLARGSVTLGFDETDGFSFTGRLANMPDKPYDASVEVTYARGQWGATGRVSVGPGKITGITRGSASVSLAADRLSAEGEFESSFRGLSGGRLSLTQDPVAGTTIAGSLTLGRLPGIEGGEVAAKVQQSRAGTGWTLSGSVTARPAIPGVTGSITGRYDDGAFLAQADLGYQRGMLDGRLQLGVTNQTVGANGQPAGPAGPSLTVWGGGSLRLQLTPWLIGTARVEVRPNGTIAVAGRIGLPDTFTLFDRRELTRRLFSIGIDIPIVGIAVAGQRVGIFATVSGGLDLVAGIGPGQLLGTGVTVSYDPDREDATTVEGDTRLVVPADAGLRLFIRGGVGAGIPLVSAEAGVELGAELGLLGQLTADAHLMWTRSRGLVFDAEAGMTVQPRFRFSADLYAKVSVGIGWLSKDLYDEHWRLAAFEYGSDLRFGVFLPMHAEAGRFDFSFDRVRFEYPVIDPAELGKGAIRHIVG